MQAFSIFFESWANTNAGSREGGREGLHLLIGSIGRFLLCLEGENRGTVQFLPDLERGLWPHCRVDTVVLLTSSPLAFFPFCVFVRVLPSLDTTLRVVIVGFPSFFATVSMV
jgi:hypothetical protein